MHRLSFLLLFFLTSHITAQEQDALYFFETAKKAFEEKDSKKAVAYYHKAYHLYTAQDDQAGASSSANALGDVMLAAYKVDSAILLFELSIELAEPLQLRQQLSESYHYLSEIAFIRGQHQVSLAHSQKCAAYSQLNEDDKTLGQCLMQTGRAYKNLGQLDSAIWYLQQARDRFELVQDTSQLSTVYNYLGLSYGERSENGKAVESFLTAIDYAENSTAKGKKITVLFNLAQKLIEEKEYDKAEQYALQAKTLADSAKILIYRGGASLYLGRIADSRQQLDLAEKYYREAVDIYAKSRLKPRELSTLFNLIDVILKKEQFEEAVLYLDRATVLCQAIGKPLDSITLSLQMGELYIQQQQLSQAEAVLKKALELSIQTQNLAYQEKAITKLARTYRSQGRYKIAYDYLAESITLQDSITTLQQGEYVQELEARYNRSQQDREIERLNYTTQIQDLELTAANRQKLLLGAGILLALCLAGTGFYLFFDKRRLSKKLAQQNQIIEKALGEKDLLLREIHHRVKNNLQVISSLLSLQSRYIDDPQAVQAINEGRTRVRSMALIHQNLYQQDNLTGVPIKGYLGKLLTELFDTYRIDSNRIQLNTEIQDLILDVDTVVPLGLILNELVSNALKYAFPEGQTGALSIAIQEKGQRLLVELKDDGIGMEENSILEGQNTFGSRLIQALSNKLEADLAIDSAPQMGTSIHLSIQDYRKTA